MIRILIADDHPLVRQGLRSIINESGPLEIVGEAENGKETIQLVEELDPDLVILDISMPYLNGIEATREIHKKGARTRILILSMFSDYYLVKGALEAGAEGYLLKRLVGEELIPAIYQVNEGHVYLSHGLGNDVKGLPTG